MHAQRQLRRCDRAADAGGFGIRGSRRGAAYVLAVTTMLVGVTLSLAMLRAGGAYFLAEDTRQRKQAAVDLAEAGVNYAYWQVHYKNRSLPYSADVTLSSGSFHVEAVDDGARDPSAMLITSTGTAGRHSATVRRVTLGLLPYHYSYCSNRGAVEAEALMSTNTGLGIRANGEVKLDDVLTSVYNGAWATTNVSTKGAVTPRYPNSPPIAFPTVDYAYYNSIASQKLWGDQWVNWVNCAYSGAVIVVNGRLNISGSYKGVCTIVATSDIKITGSLTAVDQDSYLALITQGRIDIEGLGAYVQAVLYSKKADNNGECHVRQPWVQVCGVWASDNNKTDRDVTFGYDSRLNLSIMRQLRLPGL